MKESRPTIMTVKEIARYLRMHETSIYRMCKKKLIPAYKVGNCWRFKKEKIDEWLQNERSISMEEA